jgi:hypothetical protein
MGAFIYGDVSDDKSGWSVSLNTTGTIVAIGTPYNDGNGTNSGHVRVFEYNNSASDPSWIQMGTPIAGEAANDLFGYSVSLNATGTIVAIGAPSNDGRGSNSGHVRVYQYRTSPDISWIPVSVDIDGEAIGDESGYCVSLNAAGTRLAIGAIYNDGRGSNSGHVRVYQHDNTRSLGTAGDRWKNVYVDDLSVNTINGLPYGGSGGSSNINLTSVNGDIIPSINNSYKLGDVTRNWSNAYIRDISATNISISGSIVPLLDLSSNLGSSLKRWKSVYVDDLSVNTINGLPYGGSGGSSNILLTSVISDIIPYTNNTYKLGDFTRNWSNAYIRDISATNISISGNIVPVSLTLTDPSWIQLGTNIDGELGNDQSGFSVSLNADGTIVAIGAVNNNGINGSGSNSGHVRVYQYNNDASDPSWIQLGTDIDGEFPGDRSGGSISLNALGTIVAIGAVSNDGISLGGDSGHVRIYELNRNNNASASDPSWIQLGTDIDGYSSGDRSGYCVSLNAAGTIVAIGAPFNDGTDILNSNRGHVRVYQYYNNTSASASDPSWIQLGTDIDGQYEGDRNGFSVSLNAAGTIVAIGAVLNNGINGSDSGHVRVYEYRTNPDPSWIQLGTDIDGELREDQSGFSVSLNAAGTIVAIGAVLNN